MCFKDIPVSMSRRGSRAEMRKGPFLEKTKSEHTIKKNNESN